MQQALMHFVANSFTVRVYGCRKGYCYISLVRHLCILCVLVCIPVVTAAPVPSGTIIPTATSTSHSPRPSASAETAGEQSVVSSLT